MNEQLDEILFETIESAASYTHKLTAEEADYLQETTKQSLLALIKEEKIKELEMVKSPKSHAFPNDMVWTYCDDRIKELRDE